MNKIYYLRLLILELNKTAMYKFWYDYVKQKYGEKVKLCKVYKQVHCSCQNFKL